MRLKDLRNLFKGKKDYTIKDQEPIYEVVNNQSRDSGVDNVYEEIEDFIPGQEPVPIRRLEACQFHENQNKIRLTLTLNSCQSQVLVEEESMCKALTLTDIRDLIIGGRLSNKGCSILTNIIRFDSLKLENAAISCSFEWMCQLLQRTNVVEFINCNFEDVQIICDDLFIRNPQIWKLKILHNSQKYSFPLLTDHLLRFWMQQKLEYNIQLRADTSFTIQGIAFLSHMLTFNSLPNTSLYLGKVVSTAEQCQELEIPHGLILDKNGRRFFIKDQAERLFVSFDTSLLKEDFAKNSKELYC